MITFDHLTFGRIKQPLTLVDANLTVPGSAFLFGPSGCGKTTLLELVCGLTQENYYGKLLLDGKLPADNSITYLPGQMVGLKNKSVIDNLKYACQCASVTEDKIFKLDNAWLEQFGKTKLKKLSPYNQAYFALVRAKIKNAKFVFIDVNLAGFSADEIKEYSSLLAGLMADPNKQVILAVNSKDFLLLNLSATSEHILYLFAGKLYSYNGFDKFKQKPQILSMIDYTNFARQHGKISATQNGFLLHMGQSIYKLQDKFVAPILKYFEVSSWADVELVGEIAGIDNDKQLFQKLQSGELMLYDSLSGQLLN